MLVKYVSDKQDQWSYYLDTCVFAYNTSRHESSKYTPFYLMFNRRAILPIEINLTEDSSAEKYHHYVSLNEADLAATFEHRQEILELAKSNILEAQNKQKAFFDRKHANPQLYTEGQRVLKKDFTRKKTKGGKLRERYLGPYTITKVLPCGVYEVQDDTGEKTRVTGAHLKVYRRPLSEGI